MADIAASRAGDVASARYALARARAEAGTPAAAAWLDRALRLAPGAPTVAFVAATDLAASDPVRALAMLRALWAAHPRFREAGLALVAAEMQAGRADAACACLRAVLGAHAPPADVRFAALADSVCRAAGEAGWLAVDSGGAMRFSATRPVRLELDGARIRPYGKRAVAAEELPAGWETAALLTAKCGGTHLLGSPVRLGARRRAEGFVAAAAEGGLCGWAWLPEDADRPVRLSLVLDGVARSIVAADETVAASPAHLLDRRRRIAVPAAEVVGIDEIRVIGPDGRELAGSPVRPAWERGAARHAAARHGARCGARRARCDDAGADDPWRPLDMALLPPPDSAFETHAHRASRGVDVVIPVWRGAAEFGACLAALHNELPPRCRIVVVNDASPDIALCALLARHEAERRIVLVRHPTNRGFPAAANSGLGRAVQAGHDALLLNPDTLPPAGAIQRLAEIAYGAADIGSVTPMSNDGSLVSYAGAMGIAGGDDVARLDAAFRLANGRACIEIPTGVGFCMYVRHDCLLRTGFFREDMFAQGYGEENDWCLRARHLGWRHVAATGVFVAHLGGRSFGAVKADLMARNISLLNRLYPGYDAAMRAFAAQDPLAPSRRAVDAERWSRGRCAGGAVVMVAHGRQGGVGRVIGERAAMLRAQGIRPIILSPPDTSPRSGTIAVADDGPEPVSDLVFDVHNEREALVALLAGDGVQLVEWHHFLGHGLDVADFAARLGVGFDFFVHDSALWCPRVTMTDATGRYCGEPADVSACASCVRDLGSRLDEDIAVSGLRARSRSWLRAARRVVVPCEDAEWRIARQFPGIQAVVTPWEDDAALADAAATTLHPPTPRDETVDRRPLRIVTVGAVGPEKGYQVLLDCARDAARRRLPLEFVVVGYTSDDARLIETDRVFVTGRFAEGEAAALVAAQRGDLGFIPSLWPETWCYALTALWRGALPVACFALGAQAERVARANVRASAAMNAADPSMTGPGAGVVLPLGLPAPKLNDLLLSLASARRHRRDAVAVPARSLPLPAKSH